MSNNFATALIFLFSTGIYTMVIYEVNLEIQPAIYPDYYSWLIEHVKEILKFDGFIKAEVGLIKSTSENNIKKIRVNYLVDSDQHLEDYLTHHAAKMRAQAIEKFGDQFIANRRVIVATEVIELQ